MRRLASAKPLLRTGTLTFTLGANNITSVRYAQMVFVNQLPDAFLPGPKDINYFGGVNLKYTF